MRPRRLSTPVKRFALRSRLSAFGDSVAGSNAAAVGDQAQRVEASAWFSRVQVSRRDGTSPPSGSGPTPQQRAAQAPHLTPGWQAHQWV